MFDSLRQRKLLQWSIAYLAGAWILLQVLGFLFEIFAWPTRLLQAATVLLAELAHALSRIPTLRVASRTCGLQCRAELAYRSRPPG